ncbi:MAG: NAD-dependent epimerase/dehydratase family protein [Niveispirillum sp.]|uniref:NAD-dependent epimerase/dehydratase family protein n=1 Tax=Niveispirillum sp. TaxID=1917217 RepID=UPI004034FAF0
MHILITGADGFVGRALVRRLLSGTDTAFTRLTLVDQRFGDLPADPRVVSVAGNIADSALWTDALSLPADIVLHLASVPGGLAEQEFDLGMSVNLQGTLGLLDALRAQGRTARFVFASSVAVYGDPLPDTVDDTTPPRPTLSYGAQKLAAEVMVADYSRRGFIDGCSLRLPGIVARPPAPSGLISAFMSEVMWAAAERRPVSLPVGPDAVCWWMSVASAVDALLHAASLPGQGRVWLPPVLRLTIAELLGALAERFGPVNVTYNPDLAVEARFGRQPPLHADQALAVGFRDDGDVGALIKAALG